MMSTGAILFLFLFLSPAPAHAGFFSDGCGGFCRNVLKFFSGDAAAEEKPAVPAVSLPLLGSSGYAAASIEGSANGDSVGQDPLPASQDNALISPHNPLGVSPDPGHDQIILYTIQSGDTSSSIAAHFGISLNTLLWANNLHRDSKLGEGDELVILPVTGVQYGVKKGDTLESIAKRFRGDAGEIMNFNGLAAGEPLEVGTTIIIPDGELASTPASVSPKAPARFRGLPEFAGYYMRPVIGGRNSRATPSNPHGIHGYNGVDLANSCGAPVFASAAGTVIVARWTGWNGGYGKYVVMAHENSTQTLYAHLNVILVVAGQTVPQGSQIGAIGTTGNSTGCHVHFEIRLTFRSR
ncbi:MAG: M23 family metallopeptidase [Candidatus Sungbacteria bacterium]|uniref:M23 family metallopeptidase n=1 Tax=Candidatus Sungiibacteriota bacterium TaxID=2750080 RepID=A0A932R1T1_9BACT|nr:M23 family metallopeptidase [Candidatus Sungbacteria bacterium]